MKKRSLENSWLAKYAPPGINLKAEVTACISGLIAAFLWSLTCPFRYFEDRSMLFTKVGDEYVLTGGSILPFFDLSKGSFDLFKLMIIFSMLLMVYHYIYHYQGSRMMYLMNRLPDRWEVLKRCLTLPAAAIAITLVIWHGLELIYYCIYLFCTPEGCLRV